MSQRRSKAETRHFRNDNSGRDLTGMDIDRRHTFAHTINLRRARVREDLEFRVY